jgi:hypothetical protein
MQPLRQQLLRSLAFEGVRPVLVTPQLPDERYCELHRKCAAGTIVDDERAELDLMCAEKERAWADAVLEISRQTRDAGAANNRPASNS